MQKYPHTKKFNDKIMLFDAKITRLQFAYSLAHLHAYSTITTSVFHKQKTNILRVHLWKCTWFFSLIYVCFLHKSCARLEWQNTWIAFCKTKLISTRISQTLRESHTVKYTVKRKKFSLLSKRENKEFSISTVYLFVLFLLEHSSELLVIYIRNMKNTKVVAKLLAFITLESQPPKLVIAIV